MAELTLVPNFVVSENIVFDVLKSEKFGGQELRRAKRANSLRDWKLIYNKRTQSEMEEIRDLFAAKHGNVYHFTWVSPIDDVEYYVRFADSKIQYDFIQYDVYNFSFNLKQVFYWSTTSTTSTSTTTTSTTSTSTTTTSTSTTSTSTTTTT